ncbi:hypothetical protein ACEQPO_30210 [Bacillus sp. SL00103]
MMQAPQSLIENNYHFKGENVYEKKWATFLFICMVMIITSACGNGDQTTATTKKTTSTETPAKAEIEYLGKTYEVNTPAKTTCHCWKLRINGRCQTAWYSSIGASTVGTFPSLLKTSRLKQKALVRRNRTRSRKILKLKPDVILGQQRIPASDHSKTSEDSNNHSVSHISSDWKANLILLGQLTGKEQK